MSQKTLAERIGAATGALSEQMQGKVGPNLALISPICDALRLPPAQCELLRCLAYLARSPSIVENNFIDMQRRLGELDEEIERLTPASSFPTLQADGSFEPSEEESQEDEPPEP